MGAFLHLDLPPPSPGTSPDSSQPEQVPPSHLRQPAHSSCLSVFLSVFLSKPLCLHYPLLFPFKEKKAQSKHRANYWLQPCKQLTAQRVNPEMLLVTSKQDFGAG